MTSIMEDMTAIKQSSDKILEQGALSKIQSSSLFGAWQPIDTAPKNEKILVCQSQNGIIMVAHWDAIQREWSTGISPMDYIADVTHWMRLPEAPN